MNISVLNKMRLPRAFVIVALATCAVVNLQMYLSQNWGDQQVHKLVMPGTYSVFLPKGDYEIWNCNEWPSKGLKNTATDLNFKVSPSEASSGMGSPVCIFGPNTTEKSHWLGPPLGRNCGRQELEWRLQKNEKYTISCDNHCVVAIVPFSMKTFWLDNDDFKGSADDWNFDLPMLNK